MVYSDVEYKEIRKILNSLRFERKYVKGKQKREIIGDFVPLVSVINIEELGCPLLHQLSVNDMPCIYHINLKSRYCTFLRFLFYENGIGIILKFCFSVYTNNNYNAILLIIKGKKNSYKSITINHKP